MNNSTTLTGILHQELRLGVVMSVSASAIRINLGCAGSPAATYFWGGRYGKGEVGEFVIIEGQTKFLFGRITDIRLPERERHEIHQDFVSNEHLDAIGTDCSVPCGEGADRGSIFSPHCPMGAVCRKTGYPDEVF